MKPFNYLALGAASALALAAVAAPANAADLGGSYKDPAPVDYRPPIFWSGFYIGANVGATFDDSDVDVLDDEAVLAAGGHIGYNWQSPGGLVLGVEGDVNYLDVDGIDYLATVRGRLGYAFGPTLVYGTGGAAFIGLDDEVFADDSDTGYVAGLGIERKWSQNVSFGLEGLYYSFEGEDSGDDDANFWTARARLTYHLGNRDR
jgi:outer membrane immunogenic protein